MTSIDHVAIFWDYENCHPPANVPGYVVADKIRRVAQSFGIVTVFKAYLEVSAECSSSKTIALHSELQCSGVSLVHCPHNGRKDVADKIMLVDMLAYAIDKPAPATILLISGDRDFAYGVSILKWRRYNMVIVAPSVNAHPSLKAQASVLLDWQVDVLGLSDMKIASTPSIVVRNTSSSSDAQANAQNAAASSTTPVSSPSILSRPANRWRSHSTPCTSGSKGSGPALKFTVPSEFTVPNLQNVEETPYRDSSPTHPKSPLIGMHRSPPIVSDSLGAAERRESADLFSPAPTPIEERCRVDIDAEQVPIPPLFTTPSGSTPVPAGQPDVPRTVEHRDTPTTPNGVGVDPYPVAQRFDFMPTLPPPSRSPLSPIDTEADHSHIGDDAKCQSEITDGESYATHNTEDWTCEYIPSMRHLQGDTLDEVDSGYDLKYVSAPSSYPRSDDCEVVSLDDKWHDPREIMVEDDAASGSSLYPVRRETSVSSTSILMTATLAPSASDFHRETSVPPSSSPTMASLAPSASDVSLNRAIPASYCSINDNSAGPQEASQAALKPTSGDTVSVAILPVPQAACVPSTKVSIPAAPNSTVPVQKDLFGILVKVLKSLQSEDVKRPLWSKIAVTLKVQDKDVYKRAGVSTLKKYLELAEGAGLVTLGGLNNAGREWVELKMAHNPAVPVPLHRSPFAPLITFLNGLPGRDRRILRSALDERLVRQFPRAYEQAGTSKLSQYLAKAEKAKVIMMSKDKTTGMIWVDLRAVSQ